MADPEKIREYLRAEDEHLEEIAAITREAEAERLILELGIKDPGEQARVLRTCLSEPPEGLRAFSLD